MRTSLDIPPATSPERALLRRFAVARTSPPASAEPDAFALRVHSGTRQ